ncbi:hypothetical protein, partial [[Ruminococcus] lactaris]|uniref:hypothetical protein n=1 Tax=[Ruminococcus] lactaris TaxID=46228 RepID=UPI0026DB8ECB
SRGYTQRAEPPLEGVAATCTNLTNGISACTRCNLPGSKNSSFISVIEFNIVPNHIKIPFV